MCNDGPWERVDDGEPDDVVGELERGGRLVATGQVCAGGSCQAPPPFCSGSQDCGRGPTDPDECEDYACNGFTQQCFDPDPLPCSNSDDCAGRPGCAQGCSCTGSGGCVPEVACSADFECPSDQRCAANGQCATDGCCPLSGLPCCSFIHSAHICQSC